MSQQKTSIYKISTKNQLHVPVDILDLGSNGVPKFTTAEEPSLIQAKKRHVITHEVKIILDQGELDKLLNKGERRPISYCVSRIERKHQKNRANPKDVDRSPPEKKATVQARKIHREVVVTKNRRELSPSKGTKNQVHENEQHFFAQTQLSCGGELLPNVTPGPEVSGIDTTHSTFSARGLVPAIAESKDGISNEQDFVDAAELFSDVDFSPSEIGLGIQDWIQVMLIDEFGPNFLDDVDF